MLNYLLFYVIYKYTTKKKEEYEYEPEDDDNANDYLDKLNNLDVDKIKLYFSTLWKFLSDKEKKTKTKNFKKDHFYFNLDSFFFKKNVISNYPIISNYELNLITPDVFETKEIFNWLLLFFFNFVPKLSTLINSSIFKLL